MDAPLNKQIAKETSKEQLFSAKQILLSTTDLKGRVTYANDDFCQISGYSLDELNGHGHNIVRHSDMPKAAFADLWSTIKGLLELILIRKPNKTD